MSSASPPLESVPLEALLSGGRSQPRDERGRFARTGKQPAGFNGGARQPVPIRRRPSRSTRAVRAVAPPGERPLLDPLRSRQDAAGSAAGAKLARADRPVDRPHADPVVVGCLGPDQVRRLRLAVRDRLARNDGGGGAWSGSGLGRSFALCGRSRPARLSGTMPAMGGLSLTSWSTGRTGCRRGVLEAVLPQEVAFGRVSFDDGRFALRPGSFSPAVAGVRCRLGGRSRRSRSCSW
jgi:hypothetical protein